MDFGKRRTASVHSGLNSLVKGRKVCLLLFIFSLFVFLLFVFLLFIIELIAKIHLEENCE